MEEDLVLAPLCAVQVDHLEGLGEEQLEQNEEAHHHPNQSPRHVEEGTHLLHRDPLHPQTKEVYGRSAFS